MTSEVDSIEWLDIDDEALRWTGRPGVYPLVPFLVIGIGIGLFGVFLAALLTSPSSPFRFVLIGLFIGLGLFVAGWRSAEQRSGAYAITTDAVYEKYGPSAGDVSRTPLADIESASVEQSMLARTIDRGTIRCYAPTADRTTLTLDGISDPGEAYALIAPGRGPTDGDPDTGPALAAIATDHTTPIPDDDTTGTDSGVDRNDAANNAVRAYVVDATDDAVLLRAFIDGPTTDLDRGRRVSLTIQSGSNGDRSPEPRRTPAIDPSDFDSPLEPSLGSDIDPDSGPHSDTDPDADPDSGPEPDVDPGFEPPGGRRFEREGGDGSDEDQFVWGSTSAGDGAVLDDSENSDSDVSDDDRNTDDRR